MLLATTHLNVVTFRHVGPPAISRDVHRIEVLDILAIRLFFLKASNYRVQTISVVLLQGACFLGRHRPKTVCYLHFESLLKLLTFSGWVLGTCTNIARVELARVERAVIQRRRGNHTR